MFSTVCIGHAETHGLGAVDMDGDGAAIVLLVAVDMGELRQGLQLGHQLGHEGIASSVASVSVS